VSSAVAEKDPEARRGEERAKEEQAQLKACEAKEEDA
jgi:hypothetical protein